MRLFYEGAKDMFKIKSLKKLLITNIIAIIIVMGVNVYSNATSFSVPSFNSTSPSPSTSPATNTIGAFSSPSPSPSAIPSPTPSSSNVSTYGNNGSTGTTSGTSNTKLPKTGVDYSIIFIILLCSGCAVFAYKKVKDYSDIKY